MAFPNSPPAAGEPITAAGWNSFCQSISDRIDDLRAAGGSATRYNHVDVVAGETEISATVINRAVTAMSRYTSTTSASRGQLITADYFADLRAMRSSTFSEIQRRIDALNEKDDD